MRDGLIPTCFPTASEGLYHTADATLWFFRDQALHAGDGDDETLRKLMPVLLDIVQHHLRGTHFGITSIRRWPLHAGAEVPS